MVEPRASLPTPRACGTDRRPRAASLAHKGLELALSLVRRRHLPRASPASSLPHAHQEYSSPTTTIPLLSQPPPVRRSGAKPIPPLLKITPQLRRFGTPPSVRGFTKVPPCPIDPPRVPLPPVNVSRTRAARGPVGDLCTRSRPDSFLPCTRLMHKSASNPHTRTIDHGQRLC